MNETFWGLYEAQIAALKDCKSPEEANLIMLETAKFLVEHVDLSDSTMGLYDKFGIRKLFAAHNALGAAVTAFYDAKKDVLDPGARNGAIGQKITTLTEQIASTAAALQQLQELEKDLFAKEDELKALEKELEDWKLTHTGTYDLLRAKGLGELNATDLRKVCFEQERYKRITVSDAKATTNLLEVLQGSAVEPRKKYIYENAKELGFNFI